MHRSSLIQKNNRSNSRAKTPQNSKQQLLRPKRETQSLAKTNIASITNPSSLKKIQQKSLLLQSIQQNSVSKRYFYLGKGNNHQMVRKIVLRRKNWVQTENKEEFLHFKWSQSQWGFKYHLIGKSCLCFNHFEYHRQVSNKMRLVRNMINFCQSNKLNAFNYVPLTYIIDLTSCEEDLALHNFIKFYNRNLPSSNTQHRMDSVILPRIKHQNYNITPNHQSKRPQGLFYCQPIMAKTFISDSEQGKSPYLWILKPTFMNRGRGVALFNSLEEFEKLIWKYYQGQDLQDYGDRTFNMEEFEAIQHEVQTPKKQQKLSQQKKEQQKTPKTQNSKVTSNNYESNNKNQTTIAAKESQNINNINSNKKQPSAIKKTTNNETSNFMSQTSNLQRKQTENNNGLKVFTFVVQKYIQSPMLINERKFDIRVWAMLTQNYEVFFFKEGYLRFSSFKYSTKHHNNPFIHLTNNSVQKHSAQYNEESGNQMYLSDMKNYMPEQNYHKLQAKIRQIIWISMIAARRKINVNGRKECFQIFGYDFMVDSQFKVWLIEVNTNPAIDDCSPMLKAMIPRMLDDAFKLTLDKIFINKMCENAQLLHVPNYKDDENMWELLGDYRQGINQKTMGKKLTFLRR